MIRSWVTKWDSDKSGPKEADSVARASCIGSTGACCFHAHAGNACPCHRSIGRKSRIRERVVVVRTSGPAIA
jgi:hypothetical protein